jgi:hypothetical protein
MKPYDKVKVRGVTLNRRTNRALKYAEKLAGFKFTVTQGSYTRGVSASAGTHSGGGAIDIRTRGLSDKRRIKMVQSLKKAGFAAWYRRISDGFSGPHVHALCIGDKEMHSSARSQVRSFDNRRNGLRNNKPDLTYRPKPKVQFSWAANKPVKR